MSSLPVSLLKLISSNLWSTLPHGDFKSSWKGNNNNNISLLLMEGVVAAYGKMRGLLTRLSNSSANLLSCLHQKGPSLMVNLSRPCIIFGQFGRKKVAFCLINTSTTCQNQDSPTFPTAQASGMLSVKSWAELFSVLAHLIRCLKWKHYVSLLCRELYSWFSLSFSFNIWNDFITSYDFFMSEYIWETERSLPVEAAICKTVRDSISRGIKKWERWFINSSCIFSWLPRKLNLFSPPETSAHFYYINLCLMLTCHQFTHDGENLVLFLH